MVSPRAAVNSLTGKETRPNVRCPLHTVVAICWSPKIQLIRIPCKQGDRPALAYAVGRIRTKTPFRPHSRARPGGGARRGGRRVPLFLRAAARCHAAALRFPAGGGWRSEILGGAQRPDPGSGGKAPGRPRGGPSARIRRFRRQHSRGKL